MNKTALDILHTEEPAEVFLLLDNSESSVLDFMKFILADLILKKVLVLEKNIRKAHPRDKRARYFVDIKTGPNYLYYKAQSYEEVFLQEINPGKIRLFYHYLRAVQKEAPKDGKYLRNILKNSDLNEYFRPQFFSYLLGYLLRNRKGKRMKKQLLAELAMIERKLPQLYKKPDELLELIQPLGGNIFLLHGFSSVMWKRISYAAQNRGRKVDTIVLDNHDLRKLDRSYYGSEVLAALEEFFFNIYKFEYVPPSGDGGVFLDTDWDLF